MYAHANRQARWPQKGSSLRRLLSLAALLLAVGAIGPAAAAAHFNTARYTTSADGPGRCVNQVDPINFGFYGPDATPGQVANKVANVAKWWEDPDDSSSQTHWSHGSCNGLAAERATHRNLNPGNPLDPFKTDRYHIRLFSAGNDAPTYYTVGDAHHDLFDPSLLPQNCGDHVANNGANGSGFDEARNKLRDAFKAAGYQVTTQWWGNTQTFKQCNDTDETPSDPWSGSDGYTVWVYSPDPPAVATTPPPGAPPSLFRQIFTVDQSAGGMAVLPGKLLRTEGQPLVSDSDVNALYDNSGLWWFYMLAAHNRDSFEGHGRTLRATTGETLTDGNGTVHKTAYWSTVDLQTAFSRGWGTKDAVGHEFTHGVTQFTANLSPLNAESGGLNEGFSDIIGSQVDSAGPNPWWLIGDTFPRADIDGKIAIRDMRNPANPDVWQPGATNASQVDVCTDPHNSAGVPDKAFVLLSDAIGQVKATRIFYKAVTGGYLNPQSGFAAARRATIQTADPSDVLAVSNAWDAVGVTSSYVGDPLAVCQYWLTSPVPTVIFCVTASVLAEPGLLGSQGPSAGEIRKAAYAFRDGPMKKEPAGRYYEALYNKYTGRVTELLLVEPELRQRAAGLLQGVTPSVQAYLQGQGGQAKVPRALAERMDAFAAAVADADRKHGGGELATAIEKERSAIQVDDVAGKNLNAVRALLNHVVEGRDKQGNPHD